MRLLDWTERLHACLDARARMPYDPVANNCAMLVLAVIEAVTGITPAEVLAVAGVEMPGTTIGIARVLAEHGGMCGLAEVYFGKTPDPAILCAGRGDLALLDGNEGEVLGVVVNGGVIALTPKGLGTFPLTEAKGFWRLE